MIKVCKDVGSTEHRYLCKACQQILRQRIFLVFTGHHLDLLGTFPPYVLVLVELVRWGWGFATAAPPPAHWVSALVALRQARWVFVPCVRSCVPFQKVAPLVPTPTSCLLPHPPRRLPLACPVRVVVIPLIRWGVL